MQWRAANCGVRSASWDFIRVWMDSFLLILGRMWDWKRVDICGLGWVCGVVELLVCWIG